MSSPIHLDENADPELIHTPRRARERIVPTAEHSSQGTGRRTGTALSSVKSRPPFSGDRAMLELQRQLALDPGSIPEPSTEADAIMRPLLVRLCSVTALAAFVAWGLASYSDVKKIAQAIPANTSTSTMIGSRDVVAMQPLRLRPTIVKSAEAIRALGKSPAITVATADPAPIAAAIVPATETTRVESPRPAALSAQQANDRRTLQLDSDEIGILVKRGQDFVANGDLAAARLLLRRAAEAGSAEAALTLGTTYDPVVLRRLGAIGTAADPAKARQWYQRAAELGSTAASQQLAGLGDPR